MWHDSALEFAGECQGKRLKINPFKVKVKKSVPSLKKTKVILGWKTKVERESRRKQQLLDIRNGYWVFQRAERRD